MKTKPRSRIFISALFIIVFCIGGFILYDRGRPTPIPLKQELYEGVTYRRIVRVTPRPIIAHLIIIDTKIAKPQFLVTPADTQSDQPLNARTTSQFLAEFGVQIAINGDAFEPWWSNSPADYYPHVGDPVMPLGYTASQGDNYSQGIPRPGDEPTLYISRRNALSFNKRPDNVFHAISGDRMVLLQGNVVPALDDSKPDPRTAIGLNKNGRFLYLLVVDGRQPFYSEGVTFVELAQLLLDYGAHIAMALDGGGSTTMVMQGSDGAPLILNSPIDNLIPGRERPVANHLGIYVP